MLVLWNILNLSHYYAAEIVTADSGIKASCFKEPMLGRQVEAPSQQGCWVLALRHWFLGSFGTQFSSEVGEWNWVGFRTSNKWCGILSW